MSTGSLNNRTVWRTIAMSFASVMLFLACSCSKLERPSITLHEAAQQGNLDQLQRHIYWGCDVNAVNASGETCLGRAAAKGHVEAVKLLISKGADITKSGALYYAVRENQVDVVNALFAAGTSINTKDSSGYTALHEAMKEKKNLQMAEFLISRGADVNALSNDKSTPLHIAAINDNRSG